MRSEDASGAGVSRASMLNVRGHQMSLVYFVVALMLAASSFAADAAPSDSRPALTRGWHSRWVAQSAYPTMLPGSVGQFWIRFANDGTETWNRGVPGRQVNLALNGDDKTPARLGMAVNWLWDDR